MSPGTTRRQLILTGLTTLFTSTMLNPVSCAFPVLPQKVKSPDRRKPRVMIDPGHGGKDPGATGYDGTEEKHVVLETAKYLQAMLTMQGVDVRLTRTEDVFVPLYERVLKAHHHEADLLVSVHGRQRKCCRYRLRRKTPSRRSLSAGGDLRSDPDGDHPGKPGFGHPSHPSYCARPYPARPGNGTGRVCGA